LYLGTFGLFFTLLFLFIRILPMINIFEMRLMLNQERQRAAWYAEGTPKPGSHKGHGHDGHGHDGSHPEKRTTGATASD
jgi:molybdopterin-containing oxidoreductase family membrane subunit